MFSELHRGESRNIVGLLFLMRRERLQFNSVFWTCPEFIFHRNYAVKVERKARTFKQSSSCQTSSSQVDLWAQSSSQSCRSHDGDHRQFPSHSRLGGQGILWWSKDTVAVVTGSNKSIGFEIVRALAKQGITTVLTARDQTRGREAQSKLAAEGLEVAFHQLDFTSTDSIETFTSWLEKGYGGLDILINNAGILIFKASLSYEDAKAVLETNYFGVRKLTEKLLPLLRTSPFGARIVNVSSAVGQLQKCKNEAVTKHLKENVEELDEATLDSIAHQFLEDVKTGALKSRGWDSGFPNYAPSYAESKVFLNAYTRLLAKSLSSRPEGHKIYVNSIFPGFTISELSPLNKTSTRATAEGADTPVWVALSLDGATGKFFADRRNVNFECNDTSTLYSIIALAV